MLKFICCYIVLGFGLASCKKEPVDNDDLSFISFINTASGVIQPVSIYIDTAFQIRLPFQGSYRNLRISPGTHIVEIKDSAKLKTYLIRASEVFAESTTSTIVIYDTLRSNDSTLKAVRLSDDLSLAPAGFVKVRFIHAAPLTNPVDVTFLRTSVIPLDSFTFPAQKYIGSSSNVQALSAFNDIPIGNYILKIKSAGNQDTIMNTIRLSRSNLAGTAGISGITTFYLTGGAQGKPLEVGLFRHYP